MSGLKFDSKDSNIMPILIISTTSNRLAKNFFLQFTIEETKNFLTEIAPLSVRFKLIQLFVRFLKSTWYKNNIYVLYILYLYSNPLARGGTISSNFLLLSQFRPIDILIIESCE